MKVTVAIACLALAIVGNMAERRPAIAQEPACRHGQNETADERTRRQQAQLLTRDINTQSARMFRSNNGYVALDKLSLTAPVPQGFDVHFASDGRQYAFSVKDTLDTCGFAYFSDESGRIYVGEGIR